MTKKEIPLSIARRKMFFDYLDELNAIEGLKPNSEAAKIAVYSEISSEPHTEWVDIFTEDGKPAGFLILGTPPNCHPDADLYIEESYIIPEHRRKGLMTRAVTNAIQIQRPKICCLIILNDNKKALRFWKNLFGQLDYKPCKLRDVNATDPHCSQYGFAVTGR